MRSTRSRAPESGPKRQGPSGRKRTVKLVLGETGDICYSRESKSRADHRFLWSAKLVQRRALGRRQKSIVCPTKQFLPTKLQRQGYSTFLQIEILIGKLRHKIFSGDQRLKTPKVRSADQFLLGSPRCIEAAAAPREFKTRQADPSTAARTTAAQAIVFQQPKSFHQTRK